jgi:hypothetical protein
MPKHIYVYESNVQENNYYIIYENYMWRKKDLNLFPLNFSCISLLRGCLHLRGWAQAQKHKWYPACGMKAIGSGVPSQKQGT